MTHLIDKSALVAEIEKRRSRNSKNKLFLAAAFEDNYLLSFIDDLEVKEVDLEKEIKEQSDKYYSQCEKKLQEMDDNDNDLSFLSLDNYAKYFFELGLKAQKGE